MFGKKKAPEQTAEQEADGLGFDKIGNFFKARFEDLKRMPEAVRAHLQNFIAMIKGPELVRG